MLPGEGGVKASSRAQVDLHSDFRELLLSEVQRMVYSSDPIFLSSLASPQVSSKDCIIGYIKETNHSMPAFIVKPHLKESESTDSFKKPSLITLSCRRKRGCLLSTLVGIVSREESSTRDSLLLGTVQQEELTYYAFKRLDNHCQGIL